MGIQAPATHVRVGRVLGEDDTWLTIEIPKDPDTVFELTTDPDLNRFLTLVFIKRKDNGDAYTWLPWEEG